MKIILMLVQFYFGAGFFLIDKKQELGTLWFILATLTGIWNSLNKNKSKEQEDAKK
jgi:hypothetical protein